MANISLFSVEYLFERFDPDFEAGTLRWKYYPSHPAYWNTRYAGTIAGIAKGEHGHLFVNLDKTTAPTHVVLFKMYHGRDPADEIDHINRIPTDNRISNLREATRKQQGQNGSLRSDNTSGVRGVGIRKSTGKWRAYMMVDGKAIHLGYFKTICEAIHARRAAELLTFGDYSPKYRHEQAVKAENS